MLRMVLFLFEERFLASMIEKNCNMQIKISSIGTTGTKTRKWGIEEREITRRKAAAGFVKSTLPQKANAGKTEKSGILHLTI